MQGEKTTTDLTLLEALRKAAARVMTPDERRLQRISYIVGMTGMNRDRVADWIDRHEGRK